MNWEWRRTRIGERGGSEGRGEKAGGWSRTRKREGRGSGRKRPSLIWEEEGVGDSGGCVSRRGGRGRAQPTGARTRLSRNQPSRAPSS
eukprot:scaffold224224_cov28-Tisochrysis_lutea.AAC.1